MIKKVILIGVIISALYFTFSIGLIAKSSTSLHQVSANKTTQKLYKEPPVAISFTEASIEHQLIHEYHLTAPEYSFEMDVNSLRNEHMGMTGGLAVADINGDLFPDILALGGNHKNALFLNKQGHYFEDITQLSKIPVLSARGNSAIFADINHDGNTDVLMGKVIDITQPPSNERTLLLFKNNGDLTFTETSESSNYHFKSNIFSMSLSDIDQDGDIDLALGHFHSNKISFREPHLMKNDGHGNFSPALNTFFDYSHNPENDFSFTPIFSDINNDGWQDLLFAGDFETTQYFINRIGEWYVNQTDPSVITDENGMGTAIGDIDNDGNVDWFVSAIYSRERSSSTFYQWGTSGNKLYRNIGNGKFKDISIEAGIENGSWGWGACMADFNLDGYLDIFHTNGFIYSSPFPFWLQHASSMFTKSMPRLFINQGDGTFKDKAREYNLQVDNGRAISCTDFDRDGDVDLLVQQHNDKLLYYTNNAADKQAGNFIGINLSDSIYNNQGVDSRISIKTGSTTQTRDIQLGNNYLSQNAPEAIFGLGKHKQIDEIKVYWGGVAGNVQTLNNVEPNQWLVIQRPADINITE